MTFMGEILGGEEKGKRLDAQSWNLVFHGKGLRSNCPGTIIHADKERQTGRTQKWGFRGLKHLLWM